MAVRAYVHGPHEQQFLRGALSIGLFVGAWLASIALPLVLVGFACYRLWLPVVTLAATCGMCLLPVETNLAVKAWFCHGFRVYWGASSLTFEQEVRAVPTVLAVHPHGSFCMGWAVLYSQAVLRHVSWCFAPVLYSSPVFRAFTSLIGRPASASKEAFIQLMRKRETIAILPGGFEEAAISCTATDRVYLKRRTGWVKYALQHGYSLTPVFCFGERECYATLEGLAPLRLWLGRTLGLPGTLLSMLLVFPRGVWWCPILPRDTRLHVVVGAPVHPPKQVASHATPAQVTDELVRDFHSRYVTALVALYDAHKGAYYGDEHMQLEVW